MKPAKQFTVLDSPKTQKKFRTWFYIFLCVILLVEIIACFFLERKSHFPWEEVPIFYAVYGFTSCVVLIYIAKILRLIVKRKEEYYD